jgi:hypothetical protein
MVGKRRRMGHGWWSTMASAPDTILGLLRSRRNLENKVKKLQFGAPKPTMQVQPGPSGAGRRKRRGGRKTYRRRRR